MNRMSVLGDRELGDVTPLSEATRRDAAAYVQARCIDSAFILAMLGLGDA